MPTASTASVEALWHSCRQQASSPIQLRNQIAKDNDRLALKVAHRMLQECPLELEDLAQLCRIGLLKAAERYNPNAGASFSSFAVPYIRGEVQHYLRDHWGQMKIPRRAIESASKVRRIQRQMAVLGRSMDETKIAEAIGIPADKWQWIREAASRPQILPLEESVCAEEFEGEDQGEDEAREQLCKHLGGLPNPFRACLIERFFGQLSEEAIAKNQGVSVAQVHSWIEQGLSQLRQEMYA